MLYDRPNLTDNITSGTLSFSDGSTVAVGALLGERTGHNSIVYSEDGDLGAVHGEHGGWIEHRTVGDGGISDRWRRP